MVQGRNGDAHKREAFSPGTAIDGGVSSGLVRYVFGGRVFKRNVLIALLVGALLTLANQFDVILREPLQGKLLVKMGLNFLIPFVVSSVSAYVNRCGP
jgi:hypothetical protein